MYPTGIQTRIIQNRTSVNHNGDRQKGRRRLNSQASRPPTPATPQLLGRSTQEAQHDHRHHPHRHSSHHRLAAWASWRMWAPHPCQLPDPASRDTISRPSRERHARPRVPISGGPPGRATQRLSRELRAPKRLVFAFPPGPVRWPQRPVTPRRKGPREAFIMLPPAENFLVFISSTLPFLQVSPLSSVLLIF